MTLATELAAHDEGRLGGRGPDGKRATLGVQLISAGLVTGEQWRTPAGRATSDREAAGRDPGGPRRPFRGGPGPNVGPDHRNALPRSLLCEPPDPGGPRLSARGLLPASRCPPGGAGRTEPSSSPSPIPGTSRRSTISRTLISGPILPVVVALGPISVGPSSPATTSRLIHEVRSRRRTR